MNLNKAIKAVFFTLGVAGVCPAYASTIYTYTDPLGGNSAFSGSFSVDTALADGTYHFLNAANQPAGFTENFFTTPLLSFVDGRGVTRAPSLSLFDVTIQNGLVSLWDIRATTNYTAVTYMGRSKVYHDNSVYIYHDTNVPYLPGNGLAYQSTVAGGDYLTYYYSGTAYQEALLGGNQGLGVWSIATSPAASAVPLPPAIAMFASGLLGFGALNRKKSTRQKK